MRRTAAQLCTPRWPPASGHFALNRAFRSTDGVCRRITLSRRLVRFRLNVVQRRHQSVIISGRVSYLYEFAHPRDNRLGQETRVSRDFEGSLPSSTPISWATRARRKDATGSHGSPSPSLLDGCCSYVAPPTRAPTRPFATRARARGKPPRHAFRCAVVSAQTHPSPYVPRTCPDASPRAPSQGGSWPSRPRSPCPSSTPSAGTPWAARTTATRASGRRWAARSVGRPQAPRTTMPARYGSTRTDEIRAVPSSRPTSSARTTCVSSSGARPTRVPRWAFAGRQPAFAPSDRQGRGASRPATSLRRPG